MEQAGFRAPYERTPAVVELSSALAEGDWSAACRIMNVHWAEIWYALDPSDLKELLSRTPREFLARMPNARFLLTVAGVPHDDLPPARHVAGPPTDPAIAAQQIANLRLAGQPRRAMSKVPGLNEVIKHRRGLLVDTTGGLASTWDVQVGITALLAGDLNAAEGALMLATEVRRPDRFPFVRRDAAAKLALTKAISGDLAGAAEWAARARTLPRTASWVEPLIEDTVWLSDYIIAVDSLDLDLAERMRRDRPSPLDFLEFWGVALRAQVRHLAVTGRHDQADSLCEAVAGVGLPLPESDGWLATLWSDSRLHALRHGSSRRVAVPTAESALAQRLAAFVAGRFDVAAAPLLAEADAETAARARLAMRLLRVQALHELEPSDHTVSALEQMVGEIFDRGLLSSVRYMSSSTVKTLAGTAVGDRLAELVARHDLPLLEVDPIVREPLSKAEIAVLELLAAGLTRQEIADRHVVSLSTVKSQLRTAYRKLHVNTRTDAIVAFDRMNLLNR